jgi:hypothetical protein
MQFWSPGLQGDAPSFCEFAERPCSVVVLIYVFLCVYMYGGLVLCAYILYLLLL